MASQDVIAGTVLGAVEAAVIAVVADDRVPLSAPAGRARQAAAVVKQRVAREVAADRAVQHVTNTEPWYQSRVTVGALISALALCLGAAGVALAPEERELLVAIALGLGGLVGPTTTLYGRWRARQPIGT
jgi:hypothetical protein